MSREKLNINEMFVVFPTTAGHVDLLIVTPWTHVSGPDPRILKTLSPTGSSSLDTPPVQDQDGGDRGPENGAQPAAAQAHLQPSGDTQEVFM